MPKSSSMNSSPFPLHTRKRPEPPSQTQSIRQVPDNLRRRCGPTGKGAAGAALPGSRVFLPSLAPAPSAGNAQGPIWPQHRLARVTRVDEGSLPWVGGSPQPPVIGVLYKPRSPGFAALPIVFISKG